MKTKNVKVAVFAVFAFFIGLNVYKVQNEVELSEFQLRNVEALSSGEHLGSLIQLTPNGWVCFSYVFDNLGDDFFTCVRCSDCSNLSATSVDFPGYCRY